MESRERSDSTSQLASYRGGNSNNRLLIVLVVVVAVVAIVAIVIAAVALSKPNKPPIVNFGGSSGQSAVGAPIVINGGGSGVGGVGGVGASVQNSYGRRSWTIAYGHDWGAHEYFDQKGYIQGFSKEFINAVCNAANMDCNPIWAPYTQCWTNEPGQHPYGGEGLMDRWYDACTGWSITTDRIHVFDFSSPYVKPVESHFYRKKGSSFDAKDLKDKKIGILKGYSSNEKCLARAESSTLKNYILSIDQIVYGETPEVLVPKLLDGTVDAIFAKILDTEKHFETIEEVMDPGIPCSGVGSAMMVRKDSGFLADWNRGFQKLRSSGQFSKLCQDSQLRHRPHGQLMCVD